MTFKKRIITAIATGAVLVNALAPMALASTITVSGNGENSTSNVALNANNTTQVVQTNTANISNKVNSSSSTGGNSSDGNTGGSTSVTTGNATTNTTVSNAANLNQANLSNCGCSDSSTDVNVSGNGEDSTNNATVNNTNGVFVQQANDANISNDVKSDAQTGGNDATSNTGGDTTIHTGDANTTTNVGNAANANIATVGDDSGDGDGNGGSSVTISGNGEDSGNTVGLNQNSAVVLTQANAADFDNHVDSKSETGGNSANGDTDGNVTVTTGAANQGTTVDNAANFNSADLDCGCATDGVGADIDTNGEGSWNSIFANLNDAVAPSQANEQAFDNGVNGNSKTGGNSSNSNTGGSQWSGSSAVNTGASTSNTTVNNAGDVNNLGSSSVDGWTFGTSFDFGQMWSFLNGWM
jgi:hypothetical protein